MRVVTSSREGKMENSMGDSRNMLVTRMTRLMAMLKVSMKSMMMVGTGTSMISSTVTTPAASRMSPCLANCA
jgi:superfamily I DNA and RNA helicase